MKTKKKLRKSRNIKKPRKTIMQKIPCTKDLITSQRKQT